MNRDEIADQSVFDWQIERILQRVDALERRASPAPPEWQSVVAQAAVDLSSALEELGVAGEELRRQNQELIAARQAAEVEHRRYLELFEFAPDGYLVTSPGGVISEANRAAASQLGVRQDALAGKPLVVYVAREERRAFRDQLDRLGGVSPESGVYDWEVTLKPHGGAPFAAALSVAPVYSREGRLSGLRWLLRDISRHKRLEEEAHQSAQRLRVQHQLDQAVLAGQPLEAIARSALSHLRSVVPCSQASIVSFDLDAGEAIILAAEVEGDSDFGAGRCLPLTLFESMAVFQESPVRQVQDIQSLPESNPLKAALQAEGVRAFLNIALIAEGELLGTLNLGLDRPGCFSAEQVTIVQEMADELAVAIRQARLRDQVQRHTAELEQRVAERTAALRQEQDFVSAVLDTASALVVVFDAEGHILRFNRACERLTGYAFEEVEGKKLWDLVLPPEEIEEVRALFDQLYAGHFPCESDNHWVARDGSRHLIAWSNTALLNQAGAVEYVVRIGVDITERKQMEDEKAWLFEEVSQQRERLQALAGRLAEVQEAERKQLARELHDLVGRNLTALDLNLNIIRARISGSSPVAADVQARLAESLALVEQTAECIRDVMANLRPPVLDDYGLLAALRWYAPKFASWAGLAVTVHGEEPLPRLAAPVENALFRIAQEAFTNVVKHAGATRLSVTLDTQGGFIRLVVADNGLGFEPPRAAELGGRQGWGLLIMGERARAVGGECRIESRPGQGTRVIVEVPQ